MADNKAFLARLYELSGANTPTELARWVGLSLTAVRKWESEESTPQLKTLWRLREKTGQDLGRLLRAPGRVGDSPGGPSLHSDEERYEKKRKRIDRALWPYIQMIQAVHDARHHPKYRRRWPALAENIVVFYEGVSGSDSRTLFHGKGEATEVDEQGRIEAPG